MGRKLFGVLAAAAAILIVAGLLGISFSSGAEDRGRQIQILTDSIEKTERDFYARHGRYTASLPDLVTRAGGGGILQSYSDPAVETELQTGHNGRSVLVKVTANAGTDDAQSGWFMLLGDAKGRYGSGGFSSTEAFDAVR